MSPTATLQIGLISSPHQTSGSDRYYTDLVGSLRASGAHVDGVMLGDPRDSGDLSPDSHGFAPEGSGTMVRWRGLRRTLRRFVAQSDVVVSHFAPHAFPALDIIAARPLVEHFHGPWALEARYAGLSAKTVAFRSMQERAVYGRAKRIIALSESFASVLIREYAVPERKVRVVPGGVDLARFALDGSRESARLELDLPVDRPIVVCARRLESTKGVDRLVEAAALVHRKLPDAVFVIVGTGSLADAIARRVRESGLEKSVRMMGKVSDRILPILYRAADLSIVPSLAWEGFGLVCLESLACGTPVLVTPVGGLPEAVRALEPSLVLESCEVDAIARGIADALSGAVRLPREHECRTYAERFAWPIIAERVSEVYREVV